MSRHRPMSAPGSICFGSVVVVLHCMLRCPDMDFL